jgi:Protein of unknown function (DUF2934)
MPPKTPENKQPKKKPPITKKAEPANKPAKKTISKTVTSATAKPGIVLKSKNQRPDIPYPGPSMALSEELRERIAHRAYEIHQRRGGQHGSDWEDWLQAEREILLHQRRPS